VSKWSDEFERGHFHGIHDERERIIKLLEEHHLTAASELIEQDALGEKSEF
jgi:hypothetical protein